jgi:hypothetical protein
MSIWRVGAVSLEKQRGCAGVASMTPPWCRAAPHVRSKRHAGNINPRLRHIAPISLLVYMSPFAEPEKSGTLVTDILQGWGGSSMCRWEPRVGLWKLSSER